MAEKYEKLSARQLSFLPLLLCSRSLEDACRRAKVSKVTAYKWMKNDRFKEELQRRRDELYEETLEILKIGGNKAVNKLIRLIESRNEAIALRASNSIVAALTRLNTMEPVGKSDSFNSPFSEASLVAAWQRIKIDSSGKVELIQPESAD
jgi:putative insertion element HTH domain-containing protein